GRSGALPLGGPLSSGVGGLGEVEGRLRGMAIGSALWRRLAACGSPVGNRRHAVKLPQPIAIPPESLLKDSETKKSREKRTGELSASPGGCFDDPSGYGP